MSPRTADAEGWTGANQRFMTAALNLVRERLRHYLTPQEPDLVAVAESALGTAADNMPSPAALSRLCTAFGLSGFERDILVLCAGVELDGRARDHP